MKAVILAGGRGTRISEESQSRPKPMVEIGGKPILWHIMKIYSAAGIHDFVVLLGYKGYMVKEYFANYFLHQSDVTIDLSNNAVEVLQNSAEPWRVTLLDTGAETMTGGRLLRAQRHLAGENFCFTYGDGLVDLDIGKVVDWHDSHDRAVTVTAVQPPGRYGALDVRRRRRALRGEAARQQRLGERRVLRGVVEDLRLPRRRRHRLRARAARAPVAGR